MANSNGTIVVIPSKQFRWPVHVEYKETFFTRDDALSYASERGYNLIVRYDKASGTEFDVLRDPDCECTSGPETEFIKIETMSDEHDSAGWNTSRLRDAFKLGRRLAAAVAKVSRREAARSTAS